MSCKDVQERISLLLDRRLLGKEQQSVLAHMRSCGECGARFEALAEQRAMLRSLAGTKIPENVTAKLRVLASHECARQLTRVSFSARAKRWVSGLELTFDNLMRPVALPLTGGLLSAILLFSLFVPSLSFSHDLGGREFLAEPGTLVKSPWGEETIPRFMPPSAPSDHVNVVDLYIDQTGKVWNWTVVHGELTGELKTLIMFSRFQQPATSFGVRTSGAIRIYQVSPSPTVRG
jgi:hypothetical protein